MNMSTRPDAFSDKTKMQKRLRTFLLRLAFPFRSKQEIPARTQEEGAAFLGHMVLDTFSGNSLAEGTGQ